MDEPAARAALVIPAEREGAAYEEQAIKHTLELTQGYPFYIQEFGKHIWNLAASSPIARDDVESAAPRAEESLDRSIYEVCIQRTTIKERRYLRAMAELGEGPYKVGAVAKTMGSTQPRRWRPCAKSYLTATDLRNRGLRLHRLHRSPVRGVHATQYPLQVTTQTKPANVLARPWCPRKQGQFCGRHDARVVMNADPAN